MSAITHKTWEQMRVRGEMRDRRRSFIILAGPMLQLRKVRTTYLWGVPIWTQVLAQDEIPEWAYAQICCCGHTEWEPNFR